MKVDDLMIRCIAMREGGQWVAICLPFDLAAQADTLNDVKAKLDAQIDTYLREALSGQDREHASMLLSRRAPMKYWALYFMAAAIQRIHAAWSPLVQFRTPLKLAPC